MNQELVDRSLAYVEALRSYPISVGMEFDHETLVALATRLPKNKDIRALFPVLDGLPMDFECEIQCDRCRSLKKATLRKTQLVAYMECLRRIHEGNHKTNFQTVATCKGCKEAEALEAKQRYESERFSYSEKFKVQKENNTNVLINSFLMVDAQPKEDSNWKMAGEEMFRRLSMCDKEAVAEAIIELEYGEFLRTPYWRIVAYEVRKKHKFRCVMCDSNQRLQVHHKNYTMHGYEHTHEGMRCLTCVCDECHAKHHGHYE